MNKMKKFGKLLKVVGSVVAVLGFMYILGIVGTSDMERYTHEYHSFGWLVKNMLIGMGTCGVGVGLIMVSKHLIELVELSHKKFRMVWILDTKRDVIVSKLVEDGSDVYLSGDEELYRVSEKIYLFR